MSGTAVLLTLSAAAVHACWNQLLARSGDPHARTAVGMLIGAAAFVPVALVDLRLEPVAWVLVAVSVGFELAYFVLLATAYTRAPMGVVYPIARGSAPAIVLLVGVLVPGGSVSLLAAAGILLVVAGIVLVHGIDGRARPRDVALALGVGACIAGYTLVDAAGVRHASPAAYIRFGWAARWWSAAGSPWSSSADSKNDAEEASRMTGLVGAITLPDGTAVRGRGRREPVPAGPLPDFGLYLGKTGQWQPEWAAAWIDWPDFRTPRDAHEAAASIVGAYEQARAGRRVEVACGGGTGRTGTVLACMVVLAGHPADDAVAWTRRNYRRHAVETPGQRRWVRWFAAERA